MAYCFIFLNIRVMVNTSILGKENLDDFLRNIGRSLKKEERNYLYNTYYRILCKIYNIPYSHSNIRDTYYNNRFVHGHIWSVRDSDPRIVLTLNFLEIENDYLIENFRNYLFTP